MLHLHLRFVEPDFIGMLIVSTALAIELVACQRENIRNSVHGIAEVNDYMTSLIVLLRKGWKDFCQKVAFPQFRFSNYVQHLCCATCVHKLMEKSDHLICINRFMYHMRLFPIFLCINVNARSKQSDISEMYASPSKLSIR